MRKQVAELALRADVDAGIRRRGLAQPRSSAQDEAPQRGTVQSETLENEGKRVRAIFYRTEASGEPGWQWLKGLSPEDRKRIGEAIKTVEFGWPIGMPAFRSAVDGRRRVKTRPVLTVTCGGKMSGQKLRQA